MKDLITELNKQHELLDTSTESLQSLLKDGCSDNLAFLREIRQQIRAMTDMLARHFDYEEKIGKFEEILEEFPHLKANVQKLLDEHKTLLDMATQVSEEANTFESEAAERLQDICRRFETLHTQLKRHECREMDLIQKAFITDLSESD